MKLYQLLFPKISIPILLLASFSSEANFVTVCNEGNTSLHWAAMSGGIFKRNEGRLHGYYEIKVNECKNIYTSWHDWVIPAFFVKSGSKFRNVVYKPDNVSGENNIKEICLNPRDAMEITGSPWKNIRDQYTPPCQDGYIEAKTSFLADPGDQGIRLTVKPTARDGEWWGSSADTVESVKPKIDRGEGTGVNIGREDIYRACNIDEEIMMNSYCRCAASAVTAAATPEEKLSISKKFDVVFDVKNARLASAIGRCQM